MADDMTQHILGTGWTFPPTFDRQRATVEMSSDEENIKQCLRVLFGTVIGERIMLATYGTDLSAKVFDALTTTLENDIRSSILKAILNWEPRIDVTGIAFSDQSPASGMVAITVEFRIRQTNSRANLVYPFYLNEATLALPRL